MIEVPMKLFQKAQFILYWKIKGGRRLLRLMKWMTLIPFYLREKSLALFYPSLLVNFEKRIHSQNGEDGILEEIFRRIGVRSKFFVEFGVENGNENNTFHLLKNEKWQGLWIEGSPKYYQNAMEISRGLNLKLVNAFIKTSNILDLFSSGGVPKEPDLLCVDIDGNDYWIVKKLLSQYSPRVICVEYNAKYTSGQDFVIECDDNFVWDGSNYFGASLKTYTEMLDASGYQLVGCDSFGVNAFYVRKDEAKGHFFNRGQSPVKFFYSAPKYGIFFGHPDQVLLKVDA